MSSLGTPVLAPEHQRGRRAAFDGTVLPFLAVQGSLPRASVCRTDTAAVEAQDVAHVLGSLQTRIYDRVGNLSKADDQRRYGPATNSR
jgi:hypothetical protein